MNSQADEQARRIIDFAVYELNRYRAYMDKEADREETGLEVGLFAELLPDRAIPENPFDDEIFIKIENGKGIVAGGNPRSCLLTV